MTHLIGQRPPHAVGFGIRCIMVAAAATTCVARPATAQAVDPVAGAEIGEAVPYDLRAMYDRGARYLAGKQNAEGDWPGSYRGAGTTGMGVMVFLASGEDPNFGAYRDNLRRALRRIISQQDAKTGYLGESMYHHGFGMLALTEAYGMVDDRTLWRDAPGAANRRSIGEALELAVRCAITAQENNPFGGWRYGPDDKTADTSVSGAVLMGLLGARNAGIEVPDRSINKALGYLEAMTSDEGMVAYSTGFGEQVSDSVARTAIVALVWSIAGQEDLPKRRAAFDRLVRAARSGRTSQEYKEYTEYYQAQALFQGDTQAWGAWNERLVRRLKDKQRPDGGFDELINSQIETYFSLLSLAVNYRLLPIYERR